MTISNIYSPALTRRIFTSGAIGNILETYDLILISLMATTLSATFFPPAATPYANVVNVLYVFLISLLIRPIGNIIMGILADRYGRKKLMVISLIFTGIGTIAFTVFERVFQEFGLPEAIRTDNGVPFSNPHALFGLSKLSVWWLRLGIQIERTKPGMPQQNGRHERMHLTLKKKRQNLQPIIFCSNKNDLITSLKNLIMSDHIRL